MTDLKETLEERGQCKYRQWGWHDGGPDYKCTAQGENCCCYDAWSDTVSGDGCEYRAKTTRGAPTVSSGEGEYMVDLKETLKERGNRYGDFHGHAVVTQAIKAAMEKSKNWDTLSDDKREALEMIAHEIGRVLNGDPEYVDSWHDIAGYAQLVEEAVSPGVEIIFPDVEIPAFQATHPPSAEESCRLAAESAGNDRYAAEECLGSTGGDLGCEDCPF